MFGLGNLVARHLGIQLEKGPQKANWALRPLSPRMEAYARNDSHHLKKLEEILRNDLEQLGRLEWHREMCQRLVEQCTSESGPDPDLAWRVKGSGRLDRRALAVLKALWQWRERAAVEANRPPFFILPSETLVSMALLAAEGKPVDELVPRRFSPRRAEHLHLAVSRALQVPIEKCPHPAAREATPRLSQHQRRNLEQITQRRDARAAELKLDPTLIASRAVLLNLATDGEAARRSLMNWQRDILF
jgi:ribonuclease D